MNLGETALVDKLMEDFIGSNCRSIQVGFSVELRNTVDSVCNSLNFVVGGYYAYCFIRFFRNKIQRELF